MRTRYLQRAETAELIAQVSLKIGEWNELADDVAGATEHFSFVPPRDVTNLYALAHQLAAACSTGAWTLVQLDNSTAPSADEARVFEAFFFGPGARWDVDAQRTILFERSCPDGADDLTLLALLFFFAITFYWHVYITFDGAKNGQRIGLQDGAIYFIGDRDVVSSAEHWIATYERDPLVLAPSPLV